MALGSRNAYGQNNQRDQEQMAKAARAAAIRRANEMRYAKPSYNKYQYHDSWGPTYHDSWRNTDQVSAPPPGTGSNGGDGGGSSSGGGGTMVAPKPQYKTINTYGQKPVYEQIPVYEQQPVYTEITVPTAISDPRYQKQVTSYDQALKSFLNDQALQRGQYLQNYNNSLHDLGYNAETNSFDPYSDDFANSSYTQDYLNNKGDFAGRGMYHSGLYGKALQGLTSQYQERVNDMGTAKNQYTAALDRAADKREDVNTRNKQNALMNAVARIASQYGVDLSMVPTEEGGSNTIKRKTGTKKVKTGTKRKKTGTKRIKTGTKRVKV